MSDENHQKENQARLNLLYEIGRVLSSAETFAEAAPQILEAICRNARFEVGELWRLDKDETFLRLNNIWHFPAPHLEIFAAKSREFEFIKDNGLPGKAWAENAPVWVVSVDDEKRLTRRVFIEETGFKSGFAFPVTLDERLLVVFSFFSADARQPDKDLLQMFAAVSNHIAQFLKRERSERNMRESDERYRAFVAQSTEGIWRFEFDENIPIDLPAEEQVRRALEFGYLAECNDAMARMCNLQKAEQLIGSRLSDLLDISDATNVAYIRSFFESDYRLVDAESEAKTLEGDDVFFLNSLIGTIENGILIRVWGTRRDITERQRAKRAVAASDESYRIVAETASDAIIKIDTHSRILFVNHSVERIFGYRVEEMIGQSLTMIMPEELRARHSAGFARYLNTGKRHLDWASIEVFARHKDGHIFPLEISFGEYNQNGERFFIGIARDVSERKRAEEISERYRLLSSKANDIILFMQPDGKLVEANHAAVVAYGYDYNTLLKLNLKDLRSPQSWHLLEEHLEKARAGSIQFETVHRRKNGASFPVEVSSTSAKVSGEHLLMSIIRDISERRSSEEKIRESEANFRQLAEALPQFVWVTENDGSLSYVNRQWLDFSGLTAEQTNDNERIGKIFHPDDVERLNNEWKTAFADGAPLEVEVRMRNQDGKYRWFLTRSRPIKDTGGNILKWFGTSTDITESKHAEERLALLAQVSDLMRTFEDADDLMFAVSRAVGEFFEARRCLFNEIDLERDVETVHRDYCRGVASVAGAHRVSDYSSITSAEMIAGQTVVNEDSKTDSRTAADYAKIYEPNGERAYVAVPLLRENCWVASLWISDDEARHWTREDVSLLETIAERTWSIVEKLRIDAALRESEERFRLLTENAEDYAIVFLDTDARITKWNVGAERILGWSESEIIGQPGDVIFTLEDRVAGMPEKEISAAKAVGHTKDERWHLRKDGSRFYAFGEMIALYDAAENLRGYAKMFRDLTERKRLDDILRDSEEKFRIMANSISQFAWMADADGSIFWYNQRWFEYTGTTFEEMQGWGWQSIHHPDYAERVMEKFKRHVDAGEPWEDTFPLRSKSGEYGWFLSRALPIRDDSGKIAHWFGTNTDITEQRQTQEALLEAERRAAEDYQSLLQRIVPLGQTLGTARDLVSVYRAIFEFVRTSMPCSSFFVSFYDAERSLRLAAFAWGEGEELDIGKLPPITITEASTGANSQAILNKKTVITNHYWQAMKNHPHVVVQENGIDPQSSLVVPMLIKDAVMGTLEVQAHENEAFNREHAIALEMVANLAAVAIENVRLLEVEAKAREIAEAANHAKDEFIALVSHELRSPLNAMLGWTRILQNQKPDEKTTDYALDVIVRNARSQSRLIEDLLDIARVGKGKLRLEMDPIELEPIISAAIEIIEPSAKAKKIQINRSLDRAANFITGDTERLRQVVENLLSNAVKFTPEDGQVEVRLKREDGWAKIIISDNGQGISEEFLPQIFERFKQADLSTTRRHGGLGIGLSLAQDLVELHGGKISAESAGEGKGATFTVSLPVRTISPIKENSDKAQDMDGQGKLSGFWILAVDDEADAREIVSFMLQINGAKVTTANSAVEALDILKNSGERLPDILLSDISMPNESGYALLEKVRSLPEEHGGQIPAVALTAFNRPEDRQSAFDAGFQKHLGKPVEMDDLISAIIETANKG